MLCRFVPSLSKVKWFIVLSLFLIAALSSSACQPIVAPVGKPASSAPVEPHGLRPDAPTYAARGPYAVGAREFVIEMPERSTPITVWYPALNMENKPEAITYRMAVGDQGLPQYPVLGNAILDAPSDMSGAPYPLVVWSHGAYLYRQTNAYLVEHLASQGFVIVAGNHEDNWGTFPTPNITSDISRPADVSAWIDFAEAQTAAGNELTGLIDTEHVAVSGHSYGGYTALAVAGALYNPTWYLDVVCANNVLAEDDPLNSCSALAREINTLATLAGLDAVPEGLWPSWQDSRVDAIFLLAPSSTFGAEGSATVTIPTMSLTGSADPMQDVDLNVYVTHKNLGSANKSLVVFQGGGHTMFLNDCNSATGMADVAFEWCSDAVWDMPRVHDLTNHFATAFLLAELKGDTEAAQALAPENVAFPGIQYETTAYTVTVEAAATAPVTGYAEVNGTRLYYEMAGAGDPVILLHGFGCDSRYWQAQFEALAQQYQVVRYDLRGFGKSDLPGTDPYTHADDLKALLDYLGIARAHIIGHSFGGENAINFALAYPATTRSLILVDNDVQGAEGLPPTTPEEDAAWATIFAALEKGDKQAAAEAVLDRHPLFVVARTMPAARDLQVDMFADYSWWHLTGGVDPVQVSAVPAAQRLGEIQAPTLVIIGELDNEYQQVMVEIAVQGIPGAQKVVMPGLDHSPFLEDPEGFNQLVLEFLAGK